MSSFVKFKKDDKLEIKGVRTSIRNGQIASTGSDGLDFVIGGGIEVSSLMLIGKQMLGYLSDICDKYHCLLTLSQVKTNMGDMLISLQSCFLLMDFITNIKFTT